MQANIHPLKRSIVMPEKPEPPLVAVLGATASGKHDLALALAREFPVEIVSVDSMKVYRGMDIGTAKPSRERRLDPPHHMIDLADPDEPYTAVRFGHEARTVIEGIRVRGRIPLLVGGSGLYLRAVLGWIFPGPEADPALRDRLRLEAESGGVERLHQRLSGVDPETAAEVGLRDLKRIIRALEVYERIGVPISRLRAEHARGPSPFPAPLLLCLRWRREALYDRIDGRVSSMMRAGWMAEVRGLRGKGYSPDLPAFRALGYATLWKVLEGGMGLEEAVETIQRETRRFSKRQMVWFRGMPGIQWVDVPDSDGRGCVSVVSGRIAECLARRGGDLSRKKISSCSASEREW